MSSVTLERYNKDKHGSIDDCDYVILCDFRNRPLAIEIAEKMGYSIRFGDIEIYPDMVVCCHA